MNAPTQTSLLVIVVVCLVLLTACDSVLQVGVMPTATPAPSPTPVLGTYANDEYGFAFQYPSTWILSQTPNEVRLTRGTLTLFIGYQRAMEAMNLSGRTGMPAGDLIYDGKIWFLGQVIPVHILEYQRKDKAVFYGESGQLQVDELIFFISFEDRDAIHYDQLDIPKDLQAEVQDILESFERIEATGAPPTSTPAPGDEGPAVERILFAPGATSATLTGSLEEGEMRHYVLHALAGQRMIAAPRATTGQVGMVLSSADGQVLLSGRVGPPDGPYDGILPTSQDCLISVQARGDTGADYSLEITVLEEDASRATMLVAARE